MQMPLETCGTEGSGCQVMVGVKGMEVTTGKHTVFSVTAEEEAPEEEEASRQRNGYVQTEMCYKCKVYTGFQKLSIKNVNYLNFYTDYMLKYYVLYIVLNRI